MGTFYVNDTNGNDGTGQEDNPARPYKTIGAAIAAANTDGDVVEITDEATYDDESQLVVAASNITLTHTASELGRPVFDASGFATTEAIGLGTNTASTRRGFVLNGIEIKGSHNSSGHDLFDNSGNSTGANDMRITDCFIHGFSSLSDKNLAVGAGATFQIQSSSFMFSPGDTVAIRAFGAGDGEVIINNCFFSRSYTSTPLGVLDGFQGGGGINTTASFCTFIFNPVDPGGAQGHVGNSTPIINRFSKVINCVIRGPGDASSGNSNTRGIKGVTDHSFNVVNDMGTNGVPFANSAGNAESAGTGDLTDAVTFVNGSAVGRTESVIQSYALAEGSVGIDQGITFNSVTVDINGTSRPQGVGFDMGAFETLAPYWQESDNDETDNIKFGPNSFEIRGTRNKLKTQRFPRASENRQAPYFITIPGPANIRGRKTPYKSET